MRKFTNKVVCSLRYTVHRLKKTIGCIPKGFSLIEILVVIAIISTLTGIGFISVNNALQKGRDSRRKTDLEAVKSAITAYYMDHGTFPPDPAVDSNIQFRSDNTGDWIPGLSQYFSKNAKDPRQTGTFTVPPPVPVTQTYTFYSRSTNGNLIYQKNSNPPDYATFCSSGSGQGTIGQWKVGASYYAYRVYLAFDSSGIPDDAAITSATLQLSGSNASTAPFNLQIRNFDWQDNRVCPPVPPPFVSGDWGGIDASGTPPSSTIVGSSPLAYGWDWSPATISLSQLSSTISKTGLTSFMLTQEREANNTAPTGNEKLDTSMTISGNPTTDPKLSVTSTFIPPPPQTECNALFIYCYTVSPDRTSFTLWAQMENNNDQALYSKPAATCQNPSPPTPDYNYCVEAPK